MPLVKSMYRFALRPRWLAGHVLIAMAVVSMVSLGFWQLRRLDERQALRARLEQRSRSVVPLGDAPVDPAAAEFVRTRAVGVYQPAGEVLLRFRSRGGVPGHHVLTPLVLDDGSGILVNRGWVPLEVAERWPSSEGQPPPGRVQVEGLLLRGESASRFKPTSQGGALFVGSVDLDALDRHIPLELRDVYLQRLGPGADSFPVPLPAPEAGNGPHLAYALQWFAFSGIFAVGWVLLLRSQATRPDLVD